MNTRKINPHETELHSSIYNSAQSLVIAVECAVLNSSLRLPFSRTDDVWGSLFGLLGLKTGYNLR